MNETEQPMVIDGVTVYTHDEDRIRWLYVPLGPTLELDPQGKPKLSVIEAGSAAFLQCTVRLALNDSPRDRLLQRLQRKEPTAKYLEAIPVTVQRIVMETQTGGQWRVIAESNSSRLPPWTAALASALAPEALAAVKAAIAGEHKRLRLRAWMELPPSPTSSRESRETIDVAVETPQGGAAANYEATASHSTSSQPGPALELSTDIADCLSTDAVDQ
jgi:hypothetical protein